MKPAEPIKEYPDELLSVGSELHVVTWNLGKRVRGAVLPQLGELCTAEHSALVALQECRGKLPIPDNYGAHFGQSFRLGPFSAGHGVMTLCSAQPSEAVVLQAPHRELRVTTPKVALATCYPISDGRSLLVLNVHALNFDLKGALFLAQIEELGVRLDQHHGPVLFCGDFNTWHPERLDQLRAVAGARGLDEVLADNGSGRTGGATRLGNRVFGIDTGLELDRIFYRGLQLLDQRWLHRFDASDHIPLHARFAF